jgi:hypothetical protein
MARSPVPGVHVPLSRKRPTDPDGFETIREMRRRGDAANDACFSRPQGAFGVRQIAAAFKNGLMCSFFKVFLKAAASCRTKALLPKTMRH